MEAIAMCRLFLLISFKYNTLSLLCHCGSKTVAVSWGWDFYQLKKAISPLMTPKIVPA
jgi:hypothetical protein